MSDPKSTDINSFGEIVAAAEGPVGVIYLYDSIGLDSWWTFTPTLFRELVADLGDVKSYAIRILSGGGSTVAAFAIASEIKRLVSKGKTVVAEVEAAASAATVVALACSEIKISATGWWMIHHASSDDGVTNAIQKQKSIDRLVKVNAQLVELYWNQSNQSREQIESLMTEETFLSGTEAIEMEFATSVLEFDTEASQALAAADLDSLCSSEDRMALLSSVCASVSSSRPAAQEGGDLMSEKSTEPEVVVATIEQIEAMAPTAESDWKLGQLKAKSTIDQVRDNWRAEEASQHETTLAALSEANDTIAPLKAAADTAAAAAAADANDDDEGPLGQQREGKEKGGATDAVAEWKERQKTVMAEDGLSRQQATKWLIKNESDLFARYTAEYAAQNPVAKRPGS